MRNKNATKQKQVRAYEFGQTVKFSSEATRAIEGIFSEYLLVLSSELSLQLRSTVKVSIEHMYEDTYGEFIDNLDRITMLGIYNFLPIERPLFINIDPMFGFLIIDNLCGGNISYTQKNREITNLDKKLVLNFLTNLLERFERHWVNVIPGARMGFMVLETSPLFYHTIPEADSVFIVDVGVTILGKKYIIKFAFPFSTIGERLIEYLNRRSSELGFQTNNEEHKEYLKSSVYSSKVSLEALLGKTTISFKELKQINIGDVIILDRKVNSPIELLVQGVPQYKVKSGVTEKKFAVQIISKIEKE